MADGLRVRPGAGGHRQAAGCGPSEDGRGSTFSGAPGGGRQASWQQLPARADADTEDIEGQCERDEDSGQHVLGEAPSGAEDTPGQQGGPGTWPRSEPSGAWGRSRPPSAWLQEEVLLRCSRWGLPGKGLWKEDRWEGYRCAQNGALHPGSFGRPSPLP